MTEAITGSDKEKIGLTAITGIQAVLYAFFDSSERLDRNAMRRQIELCLEAGADGIVALGLATEVAKLTVEERCLIMDWTATDVAGRKPIGFTIYGCSVAEQISMVRAAEASRADWVILQPPQVGSYPASEYLDFFSRVIDATTLPVALQNAPAYLGRGLSSGEIDQLITRHANFRLIKAESAAIDVAALLAVTGDRLRVFNGRGGQELIDNLKAGVDGFVLAPDAIDHAIAACRAYRSGDLAEAMADYALMAPAILFVMQSIEHLICYGKRLFAARAGFTVYDRAPALRPTAAGLEMMARHAAMLGPFRRYAA